MLRRSTSAFAIALVLIGASGPGRAQRRPTNRAEALGATLEAWLTEEAAVTVRVGSRRQGGSGVIVTREGLVLTAAHVVHGRTRVGVRLPDGTRARGRVLEIDVVRDLAVVATDHPASSCVPIAREAAPMGSWVLVSGFPGGVAGEARPRSSLGLVIGEGRLAPTAEPGDTAPGASLLTSAHVAPGMSGGPAMDANGRLVGVAATLGGGLAPLRGASLTQDMHCDRAATTRTLPDVLRDPTHHEPDRAASLAALFPARVLDDRRDRRGPPEVSPMQSRSTVSFRAWGHEVLGIVVAPELVLTLADRSFGTVEEPSIVQVTSHADVRFLGPVAIRGELALVRTEGLRARPLEIGRPTARVGRLVAGSERRHPGLITALDARPGTMTPYVPPLGPGACGTLHGMRLAASPPVEIERALAHDAPASRGELLLDATGAPLAIHVGHHVDGLGYAVRLDEALERFADELAR